ncbi:hypothetical protein GF420_15805 [candidate division GN15 bacterium]|nr:hypothetical protein [candidate division GN15 bacterium]
MTYEEFEQLVNAALTSNDPYGECEKVVQEAIQTPEGREVAYKLAYDRHLEGAREGKKDDVNRLRNFFLMAGDEEEARNFGWVRKPGVPEISEEELRSLGLGGAKVLAAENLVYIYKK